MVQLLMAALVLHSSFQMRPRHVFATVSTTANNTSPPFNCSDEAYLAFRPLQSEGTLHRSHSGCWIGGMNVAGEYVVRLPALDVVLKAIDLNHPWTNLGGATIFDETWRSVDVFDGDKLSGIWQRSDTADRHTQCLGQPTGRFLGSGCGNTVHICWPGPCS